MAIKNEKILGHSENKLVTNGSNANVRRIVVLVLGDAISFLIFASVGRSNHGEASGINASLQVVQTAAPFALAWFLVSPFMGAFRRHKTTGQAKMAQTTALSWLVAWPVSMLFRGIVMGAVPPFTFMLVSLLSNMVFLQVWRFVFASWHTIVAWINRLARRA